MNSPENLQSLSIIDRIARDLSVAMGPVAPYILAEKIRKFGTELQNFPAERLSELIERSSLEISDENKRISFQKMALADLDNYRSRISSSPEELGD